jgi:hypothetical protein
MLSCHRKRAEGMQQSSAYLYFACADRILEAKEGARYPGRRSELMRALHEHLTLSAQAQPADRN